jgi:aspartate-semialdehyde dehydrogenase
MFNVAIAGASGIVGTTVLSILEERRFPVKNLYLLGSHRSTDETREFKGKSHFIENIATFDFSKTQLCFFCTANEISAEYAPKAAALGNIVIDKSSYYRYDKDVPLIVPEVNERAIAGFRKKNIIANPNCNTIPIVVAIKPIYDAVGIKRMNIATYQSVSGSGKYAIAELAEQTAQLLNGKPAKHKMYPQQIAFNVLPHCDDFQKNGYTKEEMKIIWETQKIMGDDSIAINPTAVRVPVFFGHSAAVHLETKKKISAKRAIKVIEKMSGVQVDTGTYPYSTPINHAAGKDLIYVGRIREDLSYDKGLDMWVVTDNVRKGAALNAIQIAECLIENYI